MSTTCPCHSTSAYAECCKPYHDKEKEAPTALALMRSRYSAYALGLADYLIRTTHRDNVEYQKNTNAWKQDLLKHCSSTQFLNLEILETGNPMPKHPEVQTVTFRATLSQNGKEFQLNEKSYFLNIGPRWLYHSGEAAGSK